MTEAKGREINADVIDEDADDEDAQKDRYLTFKTGDEDFGIDIASVIEIIGLQKITAVPDMPDFIKGVINLRGKVIPVLDVRSRFRLPAIEYNERSCVIVVSIKDLNIGLLVDAVREVMNIPAANLSSAHNISGKGHGRFVGAMGRVGDDVKIILDLEKLLKENEMAWLSEAGSAQAPGGG
ncbi:MAG: chemotaxis protein CheW [Bdellovibrionales bacterium RIFOXYD1_FULL_53_11]|nr:MAG: chemotaxis protein CheW [Bdellovibrionales bacterium RIFOXYD1_FULL_53_11]